MSNANPTAVPEAWNATAQEYPQRNVAELFEDEARRRPEAVALIFAEEQVAYAELNRRANRLAHYLRKRGVGPDTPVGLCLERSVEMIVALLGILKAGGAYVALDPTYRAERLALMLKNAEVPLLLTQERLRDRLPDYQGTLVYLEREQSELDLESEENPGSGAGLDHLAYISYTSGSTGVPKGVAIPHRGVVRLVKAGGFAAMSVQETFLQMAPVGFDASTFEIWGALLNGARLAVMPPQTPSLEELGLALRQNSVTTLWLTAGLFHLMVDERLDDLRGLRQLLAGGDVLSPAHVRRAVEALPDCKIINGYGPTENTTFTCCHLIDESDADGCTSVPLGRPIGNTTVFIVDEKMTPVPVGVTGELYIGGDGLARGYWREPELTAVSFIINPFPHTPGARLYKSGDLARWRADGVVEFVGRADEQVKVSGYRIELGEIETALRQHEAVRDVAVTAREGRGGKEFVAYVIPAATGTPSAIDLRAFLRRTLPDAAIPIEYVALSAFPLTSNGKVDRRALSDPGKRPGPITAPPQTNLEHAISAVWREVIGHPEEIGVNENFFDLGGNSLRVIEVHARLERAVHRSFPLTALFQYPTIETLSAFLDSKGNVGTDFAGINERALRQRVARAQRQEVRTRK
ncbi:MAG TPA: non-ribosomal peptide synthetase [Chthoniobacterales bacterium]|nr:non-ribosomal peptide synthetase [Chthoniobacterales bacterium]